MTNDRIAQMREMVEKFPEEPRARYFLAHELFRAEDWSDAAAQYEAYLRLTSDDEGAGWKNYGHCLVRLGRDKEARAAYTRGIENALAHHHEGLAEEIRDSLAQLVRS